MMLHLMEILSMKLWFFANISKSMQVMEVNPKVKMERIRVFLQPEGWGSTTPPLSENRP